MRTTIVHLAAVCATVGLAACDRSTPNTTTPQISVSPATVDSALAPTAAAAPTEYEATLGQGIDFAAKPGYPSFLESVTGMSGYESGGRWTEGPKATFGFKAPLPQRFKLQLALGGAFGPNVDRPFTVTIGDWRGEFTVATSPKTVEFTVVTKQPARSIEIAIPEARSPKELGMGNDPRALGLGMRSLRILEQ